MRTTLCVIGMMLLAACGSSGASRVEPTTTVPPTTTSTTTIVQPAPPLDPEGARCQEVVNALVASWPRERVEAVVTCRPSVAGEGGHYILGSRRATVGYPSVFGDAWYASTAAHELGHAWDDVHFKSAEQRLYIDARGLTGRSWGGPVEEDYADVFAAAMGQPEFATQLLAPIPPGLIDTLRANDLLPD